jgi:ferredoxin
MSRQVGFGDSSRFAPVVLEEGSNLSEHLTVRNSPILFGCRTGICGTCLIEVSEEKNGKLHARTEEEEDLLPLIAPGNPAARLACQICINADIRIRPLDQE